ncbi:MAG: NAD(+)/NADH kinase [Myxococcota bacterium]|nr:NAD(+)/NADH kinase [Myxococcota bacterium]
MPKIFTTSSCQFAALAIGSDTRRMGATGSLRLLVVYKKSQLMLYREHQPETLKEISAREPELLTKFIEAHEENSQAIRTIRTEIESRGIDATFRYRASHQRPDRYDLVISVGGDGTLLDVAHHVLDAHLLGVNSSKNSIGHFCATKAAQFGEFIEQYLQGDIPIVQLTRLQARVNGETRDVPVLNEALLAHVDPGGVSRYVIRVDGQAEEHKSSGVWMSTAAGSSGAIRSAGGTLMDAGDTRIQYLVREPYRWGGLPFTLNHGFVKSEVECLCKTRTAALFLDGHRVKLPLSLGDRIRISRHPHPLNIVGYNRQHPSSEED